MLNKTFRAALSLLLAFSLLLGMSANGLAALMEETRTSGGPGENSTGKTLNYVSLGDSMSNGYGLDGYDGNTGVEDYGTESYANQFAEWLKTSGRATDVNHAQLAMSAMRVEDLHWLLEVDYDDPAVIAVINELEATGWNEDLWFSVFTNGDYWTWNELINNYRFDIAAYCIEGKDETDGGKFNGEVEGYNYRVAYNEYNDITALQIVAKYYQDSVAAADIVSLAIGNGNLGVFGFGRILEAIGFNGTPADTLYYKVENAIRECSPELQAKILELKAKLEEAVKEKISTMEGFDALKEEETLQTLIDVAVFIGLSMALNYAGTLEAILLANPDAEIILVPIMNTFGNSTEEVEGISLGELLGAIVEPYNAYVAGLPTVMQGSQNETYKNAKFYYAEAATVECIVDTYDDGLNATVRDRFHQAIVMDENGNPGMVWGLLGDMVVPVTLAEIECYEGLDDAGKLADAATDADLAMSISMYLAFEKAIIAGKDNPVTVESILGLSALFVPGANPFGPIMEDFYAAAAVAGQEKLGAIAAVLAPEMKAGLEATLNEKVHGYLISLGMSDQEANAFVVTVEVTAEDVEAILTAETDEDKAAAAAVIAQKAIDAVVDVLGPVYVNMVAANVTDALNAMLNAYASYLKSQYWRALTGDYAAEYTPEAAIAFVNAFYADSQNDYATLKDRIEYVYYNYDISTMNAGPEAIFNWLKQDLDELAAMAGAIQNEEAIAAVVTEMLNGMVDGGDAKAYISGMLIQMLSAQEITDLIESMTTLLVMPDVLGATVAESELSGLLALFARCIIGNGIGAHPSAKGHDALAEAVINAYENEYTAADETLKNAIYLITEYYDEAYAYGYAYALENGYITNAVNAITDVQNKLNAIDLSDIEMTDDFCTDVEELKSEIIDTLEEAKNLINEADVLDQASLDALLATLNEAADAMVQLLNVLEQAGVDVNQLVIIPALEQAYDILVNEVIPAVTEALEEAVKAGTEYLMEKLGEAYDALVKATIEAVKKYAPDVADAVYNYLYNNPEEVIAFFAEYGPYMMELVKEYGDEALMVVGYVLYNYGDEIAAYIVENHETILAAIVSWTEIHGENTAELIQVYAEALGLCDLVREQIAELEKELAELEKELNNKIAEMEKELADLYEQLETAVGEKKAEIEAKIAALEAEIAALKASLEAKIAEVKAAIAELKAALQEAIDSGLTKLENLKDAIANLDNKVAELIDAAEKAALGEIRKAIEAIESAMKQLDEAIADLTGEVYEELKAALKELAFYVADEIVEAVKKYFPELADAIYNYLYNNPEEVIEFVKTYGPYLLEIAEEYGDEALAVVGYIFYMYGDEIAAYVIENHDTILTDLVEWFEVHGENTAELIQVYAEALGWCDAVRDQIAELEATLNELYAALENATGEAKKAIEAEIAKVEAAIAELKAELEALIDEINAIIADVNATVEEAIANVKAAIEGLKEAVAELKAEVEKLLEEVKVAIKNEIDSVIEAVVAELEELLNKQIETLEDVVDALEEAVLKSVEELKAIVDQLVYDATHADYEIDMDSYYLAIGSDPEFAKLLAQALGLDKRYGVTDWDNVDYESILKADLITLSYNENQLSNFAFNQAFGYVADYVNVDFRNSLVAYVVETMKEVLPKMLPALSDAAINEYVAIVSAQINGTIDQLSAEYFGDATAAEMDWTTIVGSDNLGYVDAARDEMKNAFLDAGVPETYAYQIPVLDYLYENLEMLGELGELMAMFDKEIVYEMFGERANYTMEIPVADALTFAGESYAFGYAQFNVQYAETVLTINKINPDAILVLLGHYNAFQGIEFEVNGTSVNLGNIYGNFANVTSAHSFAYALLQENTIFVDISDAETVFGAYGTESETSVMDFVNAYLSDSTVTSVSEAGHEYIKEQILNALNVTRKLLGDVDGDGDVDNLDAMMVLQYDAMLITKDDLDLSVGDVDGDGDVDNVDAMLILQFDAELISAFPAEN